MTLFAFEKGAEISSHVSESDALALTLDGVGKIAIDGKEHLIHKGEAIVIPAKTLHAVYAVERFKRLLTVSFPE